MATDESEKLLDPKSMDGPVIKWTVADLLKFNPKLAMTYHVMGAGWDVATPVGAVLGGIAYGIGFRRYPSALAMMGTSGLAAGCLGMLVGFGGMQRRASMDENSTEIPWNEEGIQQRVDGISHNFKIRVLDLGAWSGIGLATGVLAIAGGPAKLGLSMGMLGTLQALTLGSSLGSIAAFGCIYSTLPKKDEDEEE